LIWLEALGEGLSGLYEDVAQCHVDLAFSVFGRGVLRKLWWEKYMLDKGE